MNSIFYLKLSWSYKLNNCYTLNRISVFYLLALFKEIVLIWLIWQGCHQGWTETKNKKIKIGRGIFGPDGQITGIETGLNQVGTIVVGLVMQHVTIIKSYTLAFHQSSHSFCLNPVNPQSLPYFSAADAAVLNFTHLLHLFLVFYIVFSQPTTPPFGHFRA